MKKLTFLLIGIVISCSTKKIAFAQYELSELQQKGYSITLDNKLIDISNTYLNVDNIISVTQSKSTKEIKITRKDKSSDFKLLSYLLSQKYYDAKIDHIVINNLMIDNSEVSKVKFESGSIKYIRLLTQKDYQGKEYDDLPQVKERIGNGMLIINTISSLE